MVDATGGFTGADFVGTDSVGVDTGVTVGGGVFTTAAGTATKVKLTRGVSVPIVSVIGSLVGIAARNIL